MTTATTTYQPGDRVWRWWDSGAFGSSPQPLTVIRVNARTVTVATDEGARFRVAPNQLEGPWND
jgi:hypothetical protein